jgi:hypothetical protein
MSEMATPSMYDGIIIQKKQGGISMKGKSKKILYCMVILMILLLLSACGQKQVDPREKEIVQLVVHEKYDEAIQRANELYEDQELQEMLEWINKHQKIDTGIQNKIKLEIQPDRTIKIQNDYIYITGRVKNVGNKDINYFEVKCNFLDENDQVLDSDYTNDNLVLKPGEMREFEIMHRYKDEYEKYKLSINNVK